MILAALFTLAWTASVGADRYTVEYGNASAEYSRSITVTGTSAQLLLVDGPDCFAAVTASGTGGTSLPSNELHITGQSIQPIPGGLLIRSNSGRATLQVSSDLETWAVASTFSGIQGPLFYPLTGNGAKMFFELR